MYKKIKNIAIYGSCITKDPFTTSFNPDYKTRYHSVVDDQKHSFISTMQPKEKVDEKELKLYPDTSGHRFASRCMKEDLEKNFLDVLLNNDIDYIIFDINFEVERGIICYNENTILTKISGFDQTEYFSKLKNVKYLNIIDNPTTYFNLWKKHCDEFFEFVKENCPKTRIILAEVRALDVVQRSNLSTYIEPNFTEKAKINNYYYRKLENYIIKNYDVDVVKFDKDTVLNEKHRWGKFYVHYDDDYYTNFLKKVDKIVEYHDLEDTVKEMKSILNKIKFIQEDAEKPDTLFFDKGILSNHNNNWSDTTTLPMKRTVGPEYTTLTKANTNKPGVIRPNFDIINGLCLEFDIYQDANEENEVFATIRHGTEVSANLKLSSMNLNFGSWHHIIITIDNNRMKMSNTTNENFRTWKLNSFNRFYFGVTLNTNELRYKNFEIYY
ncbi:MAG: hypothetical protein E7Z80_00450 [Methanobrevibacter thaueri]|nr:hypothetical protein [Methanobrevibacter thaueri]